VVSLELIALGSSLITLPIAVLILDNFPSSSFINDVNSINYEFLLNPEELKLQAEREFGSEVSNFTAKFHNILIVTIDLFGIYFLPASLAMLILPVTYCVEYIVF